MIIGLSGYKQSGKSTVAKYLVSRYRFREISWAEPLKEAVGKELLRIPHRNLYGTDEEKNAIIPLWGRSARDILQFVGTDLFRNQFDPDIWVKLGMDRINLLKSIGSKGQGFDFVISDCRFPNEAKAVKEAGGVMVRINKIGQDMTDAHESEHALDAWPCSFAIWAKEGDIKALLEGTDAVINEMRKGR